VTDTSVRTFLKNIDFPATRKYVESIIDRYKNSINGVVGCDENYARLEVTVTGDFVFRVVQ
jgi:hypothetical protein